MSKRLPCTFKLSFPGDLDYMPAVRKYVADILLADNFHPKFAYRSEIIVDEICNNAVNFGCRRGCATIKLDCCVNDTCVQFEIRDEGGSREDIERLEESIRSDRVPTPAKPGMCPEKQLGLEIVRMISDELDCVIDASNLTTVRVVKNREDSPSRGDKGGST